MTHFMCKTCGVQYEASEHPPLHCPICTDERQYVPETGQAWTTLDELRCEYKVVLKEEEPRLWGIGIEPKFAIGQRALLVQSEHGNVLWDCISLIDEQTVKAVKKLGGLSAIALSHPHYYSSIVEWSDAFGGVPIYIHADDACWLGRRSRNIVLWEEERIALLPDLTLVHCGGHFDGSAVLHWTQGAEGKGALLTGDTIYVVTDHRYVTFMWSFPNLVPLPAHKVQQIVDRLAPFAYEHLYSAWFGAMIKKDGKAAVERSAHRYIRAIEGVEG